MARNTRHKRRPAARRIFSRLALFLLLAVSGVVGFRLWLDAEARPVLLAVAEAQLKRELTERVGETWSAVSEEQGFTLSDVIEYTTDESGEIAALSANTARIGTLSSALSQSLTASFGELRRETVSVPLDGILNLPFSSGFGEFSAEISSIGEVSTDLYTSVTSVGINQTVYELRLSVTVEAVLLFSGGMETVTVSSDSLLGETVLVGEIPEKYVTITETAEASENQCAADSLAAER